MSTIERLARLERRLDALLALATQQEAHLFVASLAVLSMADPNVDQLKVAYARAQLLRDAREAMTAEYEEM